MNICFLPGNNEQLGNAVWMFFFFHVSANAKYDTDTLLTPKVHTHAC